MFDELRAKITPEISAPLAFEELRRLQEIDRYFTFSAFDKSAAHLAARWKSFGLRSAKVERFAADGRTTAGSWVMPWAWDVNDATLTIEAPESLRGTLVCRYRENPTSLAMWSGPTPRDGITAEVVLVDDASTPAALKSVNLKRRILLTSTRPAFCKGHAASAGALGIVSDSSPERLDLPDANFWNNAFSDDPGGWGIKLDESKIFAFNISPRKGAWLRRLLAENGSLKLRATVDSSLYAGTLPVATAVIPGVSRAEEVLAIGHAFEQGANDNASGVAVMLEAARALSTLIDSGVLPRPRRTIRFLATSECYGTFAYAERFPQRLQNTVAAICLDQIGERQDLCRSVMALHRPPDSNPSFATALAERLADVIFHAWRPWFSWVPRPYSTTDNVVADPAIGAPCVFIGQYPKDLFWHTNADTLDKVDVEALGKVAEFTASYLYILAAAGSVDALYFAALAGARAKAVLNRAAALTLEACRDGRMDADTARARMLYTCDLGAREIQSVRSLLALKEAQSIRTEVAQMTGNIEAEGRRYADELARLLTQCGHAKPALKPATAIAASRKRADALIPVRKHIGSMALDLVPLDKRAGFEDPRWDAVFTAALFWCDGKRTLAEVLDLAANETGSETFHLVALFEFLAERDLIELRKPSA